MPIIVLSRPVVLGWRSSLTRGIEAVPIQAVCSSVAAFSLLALLYKGVAEPCALCTWRSAESVTAKIKERERRKKKQTTGENQF